MKLLSSFDSFTSLDPMQGLDTLRQQHLSSLERYLYWAVRGPIMRFVWQSYV